MKRLQINMLKYDPLSDEPLMVDEISFWRYYLELLEVKAGKLLNPAEIDLLSYVLAGDPQKSYFKRPHSKQVEEDLDLTTVYFHQIKDGLRKKGFIVKTEIPGDYILFKNLAKFQRDMKEAIRNGNEINFNFKLKVK